MHLSESHRRLYEKLHNDIGEQISLFLEDRDVNEIMVNPDGKVWIDSSTRGLFHSYDLNRAQVFSIIHGIAGIHNFVVTQQNPRLEAELPFYKSMRGERFTAQVPPIVSSPSFTIRKKSEVIFSLEDYIKTNRMTEKQSNVLKTLIKTRKNILVCGGPGSGKTTVTNALIVEAVKNDENQRFIILEDLPELQCSAFNKVAMLTTDNVNMTGLLRAAMRMRPDRILIGEVRGAEALDMLKAWNTGCPGGICTIHANGCEEAIQRITDLAMEAGLTVPPIQLVLHTIHAIVSVDRQGNQKGFVRDILSLGEYKNGKFEFKKLA
jgi:P-type conjugative transfer ATPase TrbB